MENEVYINLARLEEKVAALEDQVKTNFGKVDSKLDKINQTMEKLGLSIQESRNENRLIMSKVEEHEKKINKIEPILNNLNTKVVGISTVIPIIIFVLTQLLWG